MATSLTEEETYYLRLVSLTIGVAPQAVRDYFDSVFPPIDLATELQNKKKTLKHLRFSLKVLTSAQWSTLFPTGSANVSSKDFDLTLMICLLRNVSGMAPPAFGFDVLPSSTDISEADDLARMKFFRNKIAHSDNGTLPKADFLAAWDNVSQATERLGGLAYKQVCLDLKGANLDSSSYTDILLNIRQAQDEKIKDLADKIENVLTETQKPKQSFTDPVPSALRGANFFYT
ncbi:E3 ubiquitin-protein ligase DZIP3-like [Mytilus californianus]|uniref:E3 ubiquitin-protein ligase DZIP3-like n=1 Tax=Mytilus californianus TaxID=6549 RepID=UPI002248126F|nr:E3 ubiquitin-protein ligase DZIP3-like [Mytilus californianus]